MAARPTTRSWCVPAALVLLVLLLPEAAHAGAGQPRYQSLGFATFLGGSGILGNESILRMAVDGAGDIYLTGDTSSPDFPATPGAFDTSYNGGRDVFVAKMDPTGAHLLYATYLGGTGDETGWGLAVDAQGDAYVTGSTGSSEFPFTPGAYDPSYTTGDSFVTKLNPAGSSLVYSTFLGPGGTIGLAVDGFGSAIAVDGFGSAIVVGGTDDPTFPTTPGAFDRHVDGAGDAFVTAFLPDGSGLAWSTFVGGTNTFGDAGQGLALGSDGSVSLVAWCGPNFPVTLGAFDTTFNGGIYDTCVAKLSGNGSALAYATYLGGSGTDYGYDIDIDAAGSAYVTGEVSTADFPVTPGVFDPTYNGGLGDVFVSKVTPAGDALAYSTYLGGRSFENGYRIAVEGTLAVVTSSTSSPGFPTTSNAFDRTYDGGADDAFVTELNASGTGLLVSTLLGGEGVDAGGALILDGRGGVLVGGTVNDASFPATPGAYDTTFNGEVDAFVARFVFQPSGIRLDPESGPAGSDVQVTGRGFLSGETVRVSFVDTVTGRNIRLGDATADPSGGFVAMEVIPAGAPSGGEWVRATGAQSRVVVEQPFLLG